MRRSRLALAALAATALLASPATAAPRGVTFSDPAGDADGADGQVGAASQAAFDVLKVRITPHKPTKKTAGLLIRVDLAAATSTAPGSSYFFKATQGACTIDANRTWTTTGAADSTHVSCGPTGGFKHSGYHAQSPSTGRSVTFFVPAEFLPDARLGAKLTGVEAGTAYGEPAAGLGAPAVVDRATYPHPYRVGS